MSDEGIRYSLHEEIFSSACIYLVLCVLAAMRLGTVSLCHLDLFYRGYPQMTRKLLYIFVLKKY